MEKRITGHTELLGLIATPIRHSKSPVMHNAACRALGLDYAYLAFDIQPYINKKVSSSHKDERDHRVTTLLRYYFTIITLLSTYILIHVNGCYRRYLLTSILYSKRNSIIKHNFFSPTKSSLLMFWSSTTSFHCIYLY